MTTGNHPQTVGRRAESHGSIADDLEDIVPQEYNIFKKTEIEENHLTQIFRFQAGDRETTDNN